MIGAVVLLVGALFIWISVTNRANDFWKAVFGATFKPLGFGPNSGSSGGSSSGGSFPHNPGAGGGGSGGFN